MENVYKDTGCKDWENGLFYENINLLWNWIALTNADTLPSSKFASPSKVATLDDHHSAGHKVHWYSRYNTRLLSSLKLRLLLSSLELLNSGRLTGLFLLRLCLEAVALNFPFRRNAFPLAPFFIIQSHTIYDVYHIVVIVHFHRCWCSHIMARIT